MSSVRADLHMDDVASNPDLPSSATQCHQIRRFCEKSSPRREKIIIFNDGRIVKSFCRHLPCEHQISLDHKNIDQA